MRCPSCDSTGVKALPMVYASGTSTSRSSTTWITSKGRLGGSTRSGTRQSKLAEAASPPVGPSLVLGFIGMALLVLFSWLAISKLIPLIIRAIPSPQQAASFQKLAPLAYLAVPAVIFLIWVVRHRRKKRWYAVRRTAWESSWLCTKCGAVWMP
jgi:hypothetical protein